VGGWVGGWMDGWILLYSIGSNIGVTTIDIEYVIHLL
jgi:hypothetical protein